jgi:hypothetical protein
MCAASLIRYPVEKAAKLLNDIRRESGEEEASAIVSEISAAILSKSILEEYATND